jgi:hypothetical protein
MAHAPAIDINVFPPEERERYAAASPMEKAKILGVGFTGRKPYDCPRYDVTQDDKVIQNGNSFIVLGYDRPHDRSSGYGAKGETRCSSMDIVVGRLGSHAQSHTDNNKQKIVNPNFKFDAARIYISQKAAVDDSTYFGLAAGTVGNVEVDSPRSTIALKADTLRFIARENIKFITKTDVKNSQGGELGNAWQAQYGIDLIAMNDDSDMQPLVKGQNLVKCLKAMIANINQLRDRFSTFLDYHRNVTQELMTHTHYSPFYGMSDSPSIGLMPPTFECMLNTVMNIEIPLMTEDIMDGKKGANGITFRYLSSPGGIRGRRYILSKYNNTN